MDKKLSFFDLIISAILLAVLVVTIYPVLYVFSISFSSTLYIVGNDITFYPKGFTLEAYKMIFATNKIPLSYWNTVVYTVVGTIFNMVFTITTGYALSKKKLIFRKLFMSLIVFTMFFGGGMIPTYLLVRSLGMIDNIWGLVIPTMIAPFYLMIMKNFFESLPSDLYEAAVIDGANEFQILPKIYVPLAKPAIATLTLYYVMAHWNSYLIPSIYLNTAEKFPLQVVLKEMLIQDLAKTSTDVLEYSNITSEALKNATIVVSILPMLIFYPFLQKYFSKGIMVGAVKG